ncbi:MAG: Eco57I restriction-modification methylase domain-containing protein [Bacteroidales bacterium]|nr:Eco57I restriction-modification methylase domain-containing protein [Bacteroidales bacterium]
MQYTSTFKHRLIYIFRINDKAHANCLKIGETTAPDGCLAFAPNCKELNDAAKKRIKDITRTAGIKYELLHTETTAYSKGGNILSFNDKAVHDLLLRSGIKKKNFDIDGKATEWFVCDLETAKNAIKAVKNGQSSLNPDQISEHKSPIHFRPEQLKAIEKTKRVFKKGNKMLWNAKMRMGKTVTSLQVIKEMNFHRTIIVTHRPVVIDGWSDDFGKIFYEKNSQWLFGSREIGEKSIADLERSGKNYIYFASMQDLRGSKMAGGKFDKNKDVFRTKWDLLIIDEAHEGTQTEQGQTVQDMLTSDNTKVICLSGTPFNLLETNDYNEENTFTWDYVMEQQAKQEWATQHPGDPNPYAELPKLHILTFDLGKLASEYQDEDKAFNFTEFFKTDDQGNFVYENDIKNFLDIISSNNGDTLYPFSSDEYRDFFRHTFWILPGVAAGNALAKMLREHKLFGSYTTVNVCGHEDEETTGDPLAEVHSAIGTHPEDTNTITLSCGKLTTGVTVREWTAVLYLAGSQNTSPASYMQTIFRVQSPGTISGRMKTDCYVFDFAPDRTLKMIAQTAKISAKAGEADREDKIILGNFLNFCPIISYDGTEMKPYNVDQMMQQLKRVYVDKVVNTGFDDGHLYSKKLYNLSDVELEKFADLREIIGQTKANKQTKDITINNQKFNREDIEKERKKHKRETGKDITPEQARQLLELQQKRRQRDIAVSILRGISIRMPLLLFGAKLENEDENISLDRFVELVDDDSWAEFMPFGVTKDKFSIYKKYYDEDIFSAAGKQIRQLALAADRMPVLQRIKHITAIFDSFRNPDKETVLTPWRVVNMHLSDTLGGYCFYDDFGTSNADAVLSAEPKFIDRGLVSQRVFENDNVKILEINSKSGLYPLYMAYSIFCHRLRTAKSMKRNLFNKITLDEEQQIWRDVLAENIFVICKTEMARSITQRTLAGFTDAKVNTHVYDNLLEQITKNQSQFIKTLSSGSIFPQIKDNMKFTAIVGNPPYQQMDGGAGASAKPVYQYFVSIAKKLEPNYMSMIMPARWYAGGKGLDEFRENMLNDTKIKYIKDFINAKDCFPNTSIGGGICYFLRDLGFSGLCSFTNIVGNKTSTMNRNLSDYDVFIRYNEAVDIINKIKSKDVVYLSNIVLSRNPFGINSSTRGAIKQFDNSYKLQTSEGIYWIKKDTILSNIDYADSYKILISKLISEHAGETDKNGQVKVISNLQILEPHCVCTDSYLIIGKFKNEYDVNSLYKYLKTRFARFLLQLAVSSINLSKDKFQFVPLQDFTSKSDIDWSKTVAEIDGQLYKKYKLTNDEIDFVEGMIKPME